MGGWASVGGGGGVGSSIGGVVGSSVGGGGASVGGGVVGSSVGGGGASVGGGVVGVGDAFSIGGVVGFVRQGRFPVRVEEKRPV